MIWECERIIRTSQQPHVHFGGIDWAIDNTVQKEKLEGVCTCMIVYERARAVKQHGRARNEDLNRKPSRRYIRQYV